MYRTCVHQLKYLHMLSYSVVSDSLWPHGLQPTRLLCPWNFSGKDTGMGCYFLLQGIFPTQGSKRHLLCLLHWQADSLPLSHLGSPSLKSTWLQILGSEILAFWGWWSWCFSGWHSVFESESVPRSLRLTWLLWDFVPSDAGKDLRQKEEGVAEEEMVR